jgi:hypothetical protein
MTVRSTSTSYTTEAVLIPSNTMPRRGNALLMRWSRVRVPRCKVSKKRPAMSGRVLRYPVATATNLREGAPFNSWQVSAGSTGVGTSAGSSNSAGIPPLYETAVEVRRFLNAPGIRRSEGHSSTGESSLPRARHRNTLPADCRDTGFIQLSRLAIAL